MNRTLLKSLLSLALAAPCAQAQTGPAAPGLVLRSAMTVANAGQAMMLGSAKAGARLVAVGEHGVVLLSDDAGKQWRQAKSVPVRCALTSVSFVDDLHGWAVGHWGVVLATNDGGETWSVQRSDTAQDRPLFAVHAVDARHIVAVGLWSLVLTSADAGKTWESARLDPPPGVGGAAKKADLNLFHLFPDAQGRLFAAGERGMVLRSDDHGRRWTYLPSGYKGSFWTGISPAPGVLLAAGLRGSIYRSIDDGKTWMQVESGSKSSITALLPGPNGLVALGLDGLLLHSRDLGASFSGLPREDRADLTTGLVLADGSQLIFSRRGVVKN